jgi:tetratricopeptide (TPR) repeat protein
MKARAVLAAVLCVSAPAVALADAPPSVWDRARDPAAGRNHALHLDVQRRLSHRARTFGLGEAQALTARAKLETEVARGNRDIVLRFDLGATYFLLGQYEHAAEVLKDALEEAPDHSAAEEGWLRLAFSCGHLGDHVCERIAYIEVLRRTTEDYARATPTLNLAETEMHLGNLREAIEGYREAIQIAARVPSAETAPLATWGLAVALDRSGDRRGAEREARFALELERSMGMTQLLRSTNVFFVPAYEVEWYEGLGALALGRTASNASEAARLFGAAERSFARYVRAAEPAHDRWVEIARVRLQMAKNEREKAERRSGKEPKPREPEGEDISL